jgi:hypothetical protein
MITKKKKDVDMDYEELTKDNEFVNDYDEYEENKDDNPKRNK